MALHILLDILYEYGHRILIYDIFFRIQPSVITLRLLRKDKDKEKLIGYSEFKPEPTVQEPRLDRWINLTTEKHYRERDIPTLRCRHL